MTFSNSDLEKQYSAAIGKPEKKYEFFCKRVRNLLLV
jgi:hypothetical protein